MNTRRVAIQAAAVAEEATSAVIASACRHRFRSVQNTAATTANESQQQRYYLVVVGAGPAGLAAAVYGASEGLSTLVLDSRGQAARPSPP